MTILLFLGIISGKVKGGVISSGGKIGLKSNVNIVVSHQKSRGSIV